MAFVRILSIRSYPEIAYYAPYPRSSMRAPRTQRRRLKNYAYRISDYLPSDDDSENIMLLLLVVVVQTHFRKKNLSLTPI